MSINVVLEISEYEINYISRLQTSLVELLSNGTVATKLAILAILYDGGVFAIRQYTDH